MLYHTVRPARGRLHTISVSLSISVLYRGSVWARGRFVTLFDCFGPAQREAWQRIFDDYDGELDRGEFRRAVRLRLPRCLTMGREVIFMLPWFFRVEEHDRDI